MQLDENEEKLLRSVALQNAKAILLARERAERELLSAKEALERKTEELAQQREWFQVTLSSIGDAVITADTAGKVTFLNPVAEKLTGWTLAEALGQPVETVFRIINEQTREPTPNPIGQVLRDGVVAALANHTGLIARDGSEASIDDSAAPIKDASGRISGVVMVFHDVTLRRRAENARRRSEEELHKAQEELSHHAEELEKQVALRTASLQAAIAQLEEFSYSVSHDLRAPLRAIEGFARVFREDYGHTLPPEARAYLEKISRNAERMQRLVNDVLTISRVARVELELRPMALQRFIEEIVEQRPEMQAPAVDISITAPHIVIADDASLGQAISNLLANAVKFVPADIKPVIRVRSERNGDRVRLWIEDNGIGIKPEQRTKLFGMFQRLPTNLKYEGTGIGLAIVRKAVERMGGTTGVESNGTAGSRFWVELKGQP